MSAKQDEIRNQLEEIQITFSDDEEKETYEMSVAKNECPKIKYRRLWQRRLTLVDDNKGVMKENAYKAKFEAKKT